MGITKFINEQLKKKVDNPIGTEHNVRTVNSPQKEIIKNGSGVFNALLNKLNKAMPELHFPGYNYCGPFRKLDTSLARGAEPVNKLDAVCKKRDIFTVIIKIQKKYILLIKNWKTQLMKDCMQVIKAQVKKSMQHLYKLL